MKNAIMEVTYFLNGPVVKFLFYCYIKKIGCLPHILLGPFLNTLPHILRESDFLKVI